MRKAPSSRKLVSAGSTATTGARSSTASKTSTRLSGAVKRASTVSVLSAASSKSTTSKSVLKRSASKLERQKTVKGSKLKENEEALHAAEERAAAATEELERYKSTMQMALADAESQLLRAQEQQEKVLEQKAQMSLSIQDLEGQREFLRQSLEQAQQVAELAKAERKQAIQVREAMEKERQKAVEKMEDAIKHAEAMEAQCSMAHEANDKAQILMEEAMKRDRLREEEANQQRMAAAQQESELRKSRELVREDLVELQARAAAERKALQGKLKHAQNEMTLMQDQLQAHREEVESLSEKLRQPKPALEQVRDEMRSIIQYLLHALREKVEEKDALRGGETLRWKIIRTKMDTLTDQIGRLFDILSSQVYDKEAQIQSLRAELDQQRDAHDETKKTAIVVKTEQNMLSLLFHPEPNLVLRSGYNPRSGASRFGALITKGVPREQYMNKPNNPNQQCIPMRARLLISATRSDEVAKIIERNRTWDDGRSTLLLSCCIHCGGFFLDADMAWPCNCASTHALTTEHEEYTVLVDHHRSPLMPGLKR